MVLLLFLFFYLMPFLFFICFFDGYVPQDVVNRWQLAHCPTNWRSDIFLRIGDYDIDFCSISWPMNWIPRRSGISLFPRTIHHRIIPEYLLIKEIRILLCRPVR